MSCFVLVLNKWKNTERYYLRVRCILVSIHYEMKHMFLMCIGMKFAL